MSWTISEVEVVEHSLHDYEIKNTFIDLVAGSIGGIAAVFVGQPLDTIKVKMQSFPELYKTTFQCFKEIFHKEKLNGLYAGTLPALVANVAENSILFAAYGMCQKMIQKIVKKENINNLSPLENAWSGFFAAFFSTLVLCPTELIKCKLQALQEMALIDKINKPKIGASHLIKNVMIEEGVRGMFRGFLPTLGREMPGYFFFFGGYELSRKAFAKMTHHEKEIGIIPTIISGGVGGMSLWLAIFPFDVIKSRMQIAHQKQSITIITKEILKKEGYRGFYNGLTPTLLRTFPASGALFLAFEWSKKALENFS